MTAHRDIRADLESDAPPEFMHLAERLGSERPIPSASFRGDLRRRLIAGGPVHGRPARLRALIAGYASAGVALLLVAAVSTAGIGPLGA
jgi:hypothetical protein